MPDAYIGIGSAGLEEVEAVDESAGSGDAGKVVALNGDGKIDETMMPTGITADTVVCPASENLSAGNLVNLWSDSGTLKARKADNSNGRPADGFVSASVTSGADATVYREGTNADLSSMTVGAKQWLGTSGGVASSPSGAGTVYQEVGKAKSATELNFIRGEPITRAS